MENATHTEKKVPIGFVNSDKGARDANSPIAFSTLNGKNLYISAFTRFVINAGIFSESDKAYNCHRMEVFFFSLSPLCS